MAQQFRPVVEVEGRDAPLHCLRLSLSQAIFDHHHFEVLVPYEALEGAAGNGFFVQAHHALCGKRVTITLAPIVPGQQAPAFRFTGLITQLRLGSTNDLASVYVIEGYSPTYLLEDSVQRRTFVKQTLAQISQQVLADYPGNLLERQLRPRSQAVIPYAAQYDESSFTFLKRLAAARGEWLYYTGTRLALGPAPSGTPVPFVLGGIQSFTLSVSLRPVTFKTADYNYRQHQSMQDSSAGQAGGAGGLVGFASQASEQLFPGAFHANLAQESRSPAELRDAVSQLKASLTGTLVVFEGAGETPDVAVGGLVHVRQPATEARPAADLGQYRVLAIEHWLDDAGNYLQKFRAVPAGSGQPPVPTMAPAAGVLELAQVIDVADPKRLGRVRVHFQWPVAQPSAAESGWLRVSTPYSGSGKGQLFTPEVGSQVLVAYEQGQAEHPVVLGNLFHPQNPQHAKYTNPDNNLKGLQTAGGNKFVMSDAQGQQSIHISNSNNKGTAVEVGFQGDGSITIKSNGPVTVLSPTITLEAGSKGSISLHAKTITMKADEEITVDSKSKSIALTAKQNITAQADNDVALLAKANLSGKGRNSYLEGQVDAHIKSPKNRLN